MILVAKGLAMKGRDDGQLCEKCYTRTPHLHWFVERSDNGIGFELVKVPTFYIMDNKESIEAQDGFLGWVDDAWLSILNEHYKEHLLG